MNYGELRDRIRSLVVGEAILPYIVDLVDAGERSTAEIALVRHGDGTFTATRGDLRMKAEPVLDADGSVRVFRDEDEACRWAWEESVRAHQPREPISPETQARAQESALRIAERLAALEE